MVSWPTWVTADMCRASFNWPLPCGLRRSRALGPEDASEERDRD